VVLLCRYFEVLPTVTSSVLVVNQAWREISCYILLVFTTPELFKKVLRALIESMPQATKNMTWCVAIC
jgi:hypothetical protein